MANGPTKPTGEIIRPAPSRTTRGTSSASNTPASMPKILPPQAAMTITPPSAASIPALAPDEAPIHSFAQHVTRSSGKPLDNTLQSRFGAQMHTDFSDVRIHTGEQAARSADALQAQAFTVGKDIVFGANQYQPSSASGQHLLAHELTHVAQPEGPRSREVSRSTDASEREADHTADAVMQGRSIAPRAATSATVQREPQKGADQVKHEPVLDQMLDRASPFLAAAVGSTTLSGFDTGKSDLKPAHISELQKTARNITVLLRQYPQSTVTVIGHTDTVGTEAHNLDLGQARAVVTAEALEKFGVPSAIVTAKSVGEGPPLAVKTKDEVPNARNRQVEVRFDPKAMPTIHLDQTLEPKAPENPSIFIQPPPPPTIDLKIPPHFGQGGYPGGPFRHDDAPPGLWQSVPPAPKGTGPKSALDIIGEKLIDPVVDRVARALPKDVRDRIKQGARDGVKAGVAKMARMAAEGAGLKDQQGLDAIEKAAEAAIQEKGSSGQTGSSP
jgi:outer membrane protein OmpA-like peptidoglycan-associated protein